MSTAVMEWARRQTTGDPRRKFLLLTLANYADQDGYAWPSIDRLVGDTEMTVQIIRNLLNELSDLGFIARPADPDPNPRYRIDVIKLRPVDEDDPALLVPFAASPVPPGKGKAKKVKANKATPAQFDVFWKNFPNQVGPGAARKKFVSAINSGKVSFEQMMDGLERYLNKKDDRPWCHPATWLEQERWSDGRVEAVVPQRRGPPAPGI